MSKPTTAIIFEGGKPESTVARQMLPVRYATCLDMIDKLKALPDCYERVILATNYPDLAEEARRLGAEIFPTGTEGFHFGQTLRQIVQDYCLTRVLYLSGAGSPLLSSTELAHIAVELAENDELVYVNNVQSADIVGWTPGNRLEQIEPPLMDNALGYALRHEGNLPRKLMPHSTGVHYDIDTPTDVLMAHLLRLGGPRTRDALDHLPESWDLSRYQQLKGILLQREYIPGLWMSGRIGGPVIQHINTYLLARLRVMSEERGMKSMGQEYLVNSFVGDFLHHAGFEAFFSYLERTVNVALIDTRPLFVHFKLKQSENDRFCSDLGLWQQIEEPWIRDFTKAAVECKIPVILGGHTLILGGIWALTEAIHQEREALRSETRGK